MSDAVRPLADRVDSAILGNPHLMGLTVRIETRAGRVVLNGVVRSYYQKQIAQEVVRAVEGVKQVDNQLRVDRSQASVEWAQAVV
jgi:osmotically-inducible protein OsmY